MLCLILLYNEIQWGPSLGGITPFYEKLSFSFVKKELDYILTKVISSGTSALLTQFLIINTWAFCLNFSFSFIGVGIKRPEEVAYWCLEALTNNKPKYESALLCPDREWLDTDLEMGEMCIWQFLISFSGKKQWINGLVSPGSGGTFVNTHGGGIIAQSWLSAYMKWAELNDVNKGDVHNVFQAVAWMMQFI